MGGPSDRWEGFSLSREEEESGEAETGRVKGHVRPSPTSTVHTLSLSLPLSGWTAAPTFTLRWCVCVNES